MKILFYSSGALTHAVISTLMDEAIRCNKQGHDIYFLYNDCSFEICTHNMCHDSTLCKICHRRMVKSLDLLPKSIHKINLQMYWNGGVSPQFTYNSVNKLKKIEYKSVKVGYSVMSSYIAVTRNLTPLIDETTKVFFNKLLSTSCRLTDALERALDDIRPDRICFFNARAFEWRPPYDLAISRGIEAISYERTNDVDSLNCIQRFINATPHNIKYRQKMSDDVWNQAKLSIEEKIEIGRNFFERRRNSLPAGDRVYTGRQQKGKMPSNWDATKKNIVIFNSSEDEFAAIGDEYDSLALFHTQYQGIKYISECLKDRKDYRIYLRIHPNLTNISYRYHTELMKLPSYYSNITVIPAADSISTYDLMDAADTIVVFGSTMGLESVYWRKPVILLAGAIYYYSNLCYVPKTHEELSKLLLLELKPKDNFEAIKWGFYMMYRNPMDKYQYVDFDSHWFCIGKHKWLDIHYLKLLGSSKLYAIYTRLLMRYYRRNATSIEIPKEEDMSAEL